MAIGESDEETELSIFHLKDKIKLLSKERLSKLLLELIDEYEDMNNKKEQLSKECVILKAKCKSLELRACEAERENTVLKNQVHAFNTTVLELRYENLKLKLGTGKKTTDHTQLTLEKNIGKMKDEFYKRDEHVRVLKEDLNKVKHELDRTCKWNSNKRGHGFGNSVPKWDPKSKYFTLLENKICTHYGNTGHYKSECTAKEQRQEHDDEAIALMDVKSAFLNVYLKEEVFVKQPPGFERKEYRDHVYKLDKALYGLKLGEEFAKLMRSEFEMSMMERALQTYTREFSVKNLVHQDYMILLVGTMAGVETTDSEKIGGKDKKIKEKESDGAQSDVRGKGKGVVEYSLTPAELTEETGAMMLWSGGAAKEEENLREERGSGMEMQEPLEDLLKRVSDSYNPKKKKSSGIKIPGTARANKKRKAASSIPVETPPTRGIDTRSQKNQSEVELEKALEESKRKADAKGKKKVSEPVEAVEIENMDLVLRDEDKAEEEEVATPNTKKKPSTLTKKTKSAMKSRKVKVVEEEESEEEEINEEQDKKESLGWKDMVLQMAGRLARTEVVDFMENCEIKNGRVTSVVKGV
ncbi:uncharacterized protein [Nicotiana tomentosiformis]|uniref:uncharacterized protein n=1 Tax=Nicotiana tomentosiformis TaxID=4098 RepID=UPI00388C8655